MRDDDKTRPVKAVQRRSSSVSEAATRKVKAVKRRPPVVQARWLSAEVQGSSVYRFIERLGLRASPYDVTLGGEEVVLRALPRTTLLAGWHYDFVDLHEQPLFSVRRGLHKLIFHELTVLDADGSPLARFRQKPSVLSVHFEVSDAAGEPRFDLRQPANTTTRFTLERGGVPAAQLARDYRKWDGSLKQAITVRDAFKAMELNAALDELDRVVVLAAALFMDRLYFTDDHDLA